MPRRAAPYNEDVSKRLRDPSYANGYLKSAIHNHDTPFKVALAEMIDVYGHVEFAEEIEMEAANVTRLVRRLKEDANIKHETLERLLAGFGLVLKLDTEVLEDDEKQRA